MANPLHFDSFRPLPPECVHCEELLADAVDDLLSAADRAFFNRHLSTCAHCTQAFADASRGAAWLDMLKSPRPAPSAQLLERILMQTTGAQDVGSPAAEMVPHIAALPGFLPADLNPAEFDSAGTFQPGYPVPARPAAAPNVLPFVPRAPRFLPAFNRFLFEPRLAMTAAMAFFSIALTLNLTGVRLNQLHAEDLQPSHLRRSYYEAQASVARHYEGLRVVQTMEARVDDLRQNNQDDSAGPEAGRPGEAAPGTGPAARPNAVPAPSRKQAEPAPSAPTPSSPNPNGSSRESKPFARPRFFTVLDREPNVEPAPAASAAPNHKEGGLA